ncbi:hypothetical protein [Paludibacter jiangxiensis]|uniref:Uncharacterized protein n=1 Tax=Paludibacter jiangxiensis TaxID=681398 RepID=A0A170YLA4_9BACT|nr:hypothetical protein [Paludibacter jiangxiensis]GAT61890.1 hypothetical protein PJIAN_1477 [Paludibacter jiangxiensis]
MKKIKSAFFIKNAGIFLLLISIQCCDPGCTIRYGIENKTLSPITVKSQFVFSTSNDTIIKEDVVNPNSKTIINEESPTGTVEGVDKSRDSIYFYNLTLEQRGKISKKNFKNKCIWTLLKINKYEAMYLLVVDSSYFR